MAARLLLFSAKTKADADRKAGILKQSGYKTSIVTLSKRFDVYGDYVENKHRSIIK